MQTEGEEIDIENKDIEEIFPKNRKGIAFQFIWTFLLLLLLLFALKWTMEYAGRNIVADSVGLLLIVILPIFFILPIILIVDILSLFRTVVISSEGIKSSFLCKKIDCDWKDVSKIEVVVHKQRSNQTGLVTLSNIEYIICTSKGTFSLREGDWGINILKEIYDKIISHVADIQITQREEEITVSEGYK